MKKLLFIFIILLITVVLIINYSDSNLVVNTNKINLSKDRLISLSFNKKYNISTPKQDTNTKEETYLKNLSKRVTYLLLGTSNESEEEYYERHKEYLKLKYAPEVPKIDNELDKSSREYKMKQVSSIAIPGMFLTLNNLDTKYSTIGNINITNNNKYYLSQVTLPSITMLEEDENNPKKFNKINTNLIINYYYVKDNNKFYLYYLNAYTKNDLSNHTDYSFAIKADIKDNSLYNYSKYNKISSKDIDNTYNHNKNNIFIIESFNVHKKVSSSIGVLVEDGILLTTYDFLDNSLKEATNITIKDLNNKYYDLDGVITISKENNIVLLKLKSKIKSTTKINSNLELEDGVINITYNDQIIKNKSLVIANTNIVKTLDKDDNSTLIYKDNNLVGITNYNNESIYKEYTKLDSINDTLKELNKTDFNDIDTKSFNYLKEKFYLEKSTNYKEKQLPKKLTNKYKIISTINNNISIPLVNYSKVGNNISLRFNNSINNYFTNIEISKSLEAKLLKMKYKKVLDTDNKCIYENNNYRIITYSELNYLIVMVVII